MRSNSVLMVVALGFAVHGLAYSAEMDLACGIRSNGTNVNCTVLGKEKHIMTPEDIATFIDTAEEGEVYITMKSARASERIFKIDGKAPSFQKIREVKKNGSASQISEAKLALFAEIEKKMIKTSDELDRKMGTAELVLPDSGRMVEKFKQEARVMTAELEGYRRNKESVCTATPAFDQMSKANTRLQKTLSNLIYAFQNPESCMSEFKVFKDREGSVDLGQLNSASDFYKSNCVSRRR